MKKINPDFVIVGAMKCASTSLADLLALHQDVYLTPEKEPGFFSRDERYERGIDAYLELYSDANVNQITGEASTCYSRMSSYPLAVQRLHDHAPECKLIYIMRDPVKRAYSHYAYIMAERISSRQKQEVISYTEALDCVEEILDASNYIKQIRHWLEYYPLEQFHCIILEDLVENEEGELRELCAFLGVDFLDSEDWGMGWSNAKGTNVAKRQSKRLTSKALDMVPSTLKNIVSEGYRKKLRMSLQKLIARGFRGTAEKKIQEAIMPASDAEKESVYRKLNSSILELEQFLGREIPSWKKYNKKFGNRSGEV